ncbi:MAG TPA: 4-hydroxythreonine-4-phosphate dehydrogenase PdxA [Steroidobacteraceae bacterium]|nr:4-hydroxythreonine-4-phosphate dehydrogenase PdxA [Steroidobacteraceae bacterium]
MAAAPARRGVRRVQALSTALKPIAITAGEPAGIGPDLCLALAGLDLPGVAYSTSLVILGSRALLAERAGALGLTVELDPYLPGSAPRSRQPGRLQVLDIPLATPCVAGRLDPANAPQVLALLDRATDGCMNGEFAAMVTAPVQKSVINDAGVPFTGHTEYLAARTGSTHPVMLLAAGSLRVALATTHLPLRAVSDAITAPLLDTTLRVLEADVRRLWGISRPRIAVCGLNPHAGESGHLGTEDRDVIAPAIERARATGMLVDGPIPADTVFVPRALSNYDVVLAMFHDQGLPVLKHAGFGHAVNVTLGLPIVRTSVDHGTALDLAGTGRADAGSLIAATRLALEFAARDSRQASAA